MCEVISMAEFKKAHVVLEGVPPISVCFCMDRGNRGDAACKGCPENAFARKVIKSYDSRN